MINWNGKKKAVTFSYDDGIESDRKLADMFNRYGLKCTFNLNSGLMTPESCWERNGVMIRRMYPDDMPEIYKGHEIAVHGVMHEDLTKLTDEEVIRELLDDKAALEKLFGCSIEGMAYAWGAYDDRVVRLVRECGFRYSRTCNDRHDLKFPEELLAYGASCHHNYENIFPLIDEFLAYDEDGPAVLCIWGHSYELESDHNWEHMEEICRRISGHPDVFYGTNKEVYLGAD